MKPTIICGIMLTLIILLSLKTYGQKESQVRINVTVFDKASNETMPGANLMLQSNILIGSTTGSEGNATITVTQNQLDTDSIIISFIGYKDNIIAVQDLQKNNIVYMAPIEHMLEEAVVVAKRIIAEEFTIKQIKQLEIYTNPVSKADPILAVNSMPASTTTDESANISLRGSSPAETGIFFNDVPIYDAVRFSQLNGIGTFSIFNTAIVDRLHVFPSNPPLEYGNTSSGLISIQSKDVIPRFNQNSISISLANIGGQTVRKLSDKTSLTAFCNYQPSAGLIGVNEEALEDLKSFFNADLGVHMAHNFSDSAKLKLFNYSNTEGYEYNYIHPSFNGIFDMSKSRNFTIVNYLQKFKSSEITINSGASFSNEQYEYGNTSVDLNKHDLYFNANYQHFYNKLSYKAGFSIDSRFQKIDGTFPAFSYAVDSHHPSYSIEDSRELNIPEFFLYSKYEFNKRWVTGAGIRKNIPIDKMESYISGQWNLHCNITRNHSINTSIGNYNKYSLPDAEHDTVTFYQSKQASVDYSFTTDNIELTAAVFAKQSNIGEIEETIYGTEIFTKLHLFNNYIEMQGSYTFINAEKTNNDITYPAKYDLDYFVRGSIKYQHPTNLDISAIVLYRQGSNYRSVTNALYDPVLNLYDAEYSALNDQQRLPDYLKIDVSISKMWAISENLSIVGYANVSNILDKKNIRGKTYNFDYSNPIDLYYGRRTLYFGALVMF